MTMIQCSECSMKLPRRSLYQQHRRLNHQNVTTVIFNGEEKLMYRVDGVFECDCGLTFQNPVSLQVHVRKVCSLNKSKDSVRYVRRPSRGTTPRSSKKAKITKLSKYPIVIGPDLYTDDVLKKYFIGFNRQLKLIVCLECGISFNYPGMLRHISGRHQLTFDKALLDEHMEPLLQDAQEAAENINLDPFFNPTKELIDAVAGLTIHLNGARCNVCQERAYYSGSMSTVQRHFRMEHPDVEKTEASFTSCGVQTLFTGHKRVYFGVYTPQPEFLQFISMEVAVDPESDDEESEEYYGEEEEEENYYEEPLEEPMEEDMTPTEEFEEPEENQTIPPKKIILRTDSERPIVSLHPRVAAAEVATSTAQPRRSHTPYDIPSETKRMTRSQTTTENLLNGTLNPEPETVQQHEMIPPISNFPPPDWAYALHQEIQENRHAIQRLQESVDCLIGMVYRQNTARLPRTPTYAEQPTEYRPYDE